MASQANEPLVPVVERLPPTHARVIVVCREFRCLGYLDDLGVWRDAAKSGKLENVIAWLDFLSAIAPTRNTSVPPRPEGGPGTL
jgi:hypothetical protein